MLVIKCKILEVLFPNYKNNKTYNKTVNYLKSIIDGCELDDKLSHLSVFMNKYYNLVDVISLLAAYDLYEYYELMKNEK